MDFTIEKGATVLDVKHLFTDMFKGLKLELFKKAHEEGESSSAKMRVYWDRGCFRSDSCSTSTSAKY